MGLFFEDDKAIKLSILDKMIERSSKKRKKLKDKLQKLKIEEKELVKCFGTTQEDIHK